MKVSIITATYNSLNNLPFVLKSVRQQHYVDIEWIVVDGKSNDGTDVYLKDKDINKYICEPDNGIYDALNKGLNIATGEVIGFLHSDDFLDNSKTLSNIMAVFKNENVDGVYGDLKYVDSENPSKVIRYWKSKPYHPNNLNRGWMPAHPTLFLKKEVYDKHGLFDLSYKIAADYDFMLRVLKDSTLKFYYLPEVITHMRLGGASNKNLSSIIQKSKEDYRVIKKHHLNGLLTLFSKNVLKLNQFFKK